MGTTLLDHYEGEDVIITFEEEGKDTVVNFDGKISSMAFSGGGKTLNLKHMFGNKTISSLSPRDKFSLKMDYVTTDTRFAYVSFGGSTVWGAGTEIRSSGSQARWRVVVWFQDADQHKKSGTIVVPSKAAAAGRIIFCDCKSPDRTIDFDSEGTLTGSITLDFSATDDNGYANVFEEYTTSTTAAMTVLTATAHKGTLTWNTTTPAWTGSYRT